MKKAYYTSLNIVDLCLHYSVQVDDKEYRIKLGGILMPSDISERLYQAVKEQLGNEDFFLVPSQHQTEFDAYLEDQMKHPHKYPNDGSSVGGFGRGCCCHD